MIRRKRNDPAANGVEGNAAVNKNAATIAQNPRAANSPRITNIRRASYGNVEWLVSIAGVCTDTPIRDRKLRRYRRFCASIKHRFGVVFDPMPQAEWLVIIEAITSNGASS
ncbi:hypothetical protein ABIB94_002796 [Bradyrhizobium sp. JR7.2]|uniref:hypothetical protein n=1 Tax=unclassified Bradyrhizobium TaxID=2631580 RepID=UPI003392B81A